MKYTFSEAAAVGLASCLLYVGHNQAPDTDDAANYLHQRWHREVPGHIKTSQSMSNCNPLFVLSALHSEHDELSHRKRVQADKDN